MKLLEAIRAENDQIVSTVAKLEDSTAGEPEQRRHLLEELRFLLDERREMDERYVYPVLAAVETNRDLVERSRQELSDIDAVLEALYSRPLDEPDVKFSIDSAGSSIRLHVQHEIDELLPRVDRLLSDEEERRLAELAADAFAPLARRLQEH